MVGTAGFVIAVADARVTEDDDEKGRCTSGVFTLPAPSRKMAEKSMEAKQTNEASPEIGLVVKEDCVCFCSLLFGTLMDGLQ